ncbi:MAG: hypothetical protein EKK57_07895 [Proteobacteria bacterium]|nr:MAG: hypothetical protein EKK57_07895 [Pseudomonadota bacterium]
MFNSNFKMWARFRSESDGLVCVLFTPVVGWEKTDEGEYTALVLAPPGLGLDGTAIPVNYSAVIRDFGQITGFVLDESIKETVEKVMQWQLEDDDNRAVSVYPKLPSM